ncbi:MAG: exopolysaccharide biosynthesis protein [Verrucomicrobia bacterium]|nr:exopolysaccharide biosynthesis protein [Verrucomicrobiota bacterium]
MSPIKVFHYPANPSDPLRKLSDELHELAQRFAERRVTLQEVMTVLGVRASGLLIIILALPFCAPISIPGLSVPFGMVILYIAARYALGLAPWLPERLLRTELPPKFFRAVLEGASRFIGWMERELKPRWLGWTATPARLRWHAATVGFCGFLLMLPLGGIPFTNTMPALVIVIGMLGMMERDGVAIGAAYALLVLTLAYFGLFATMIAELGQRAWHWFSQLA